MSTHEDRLAAALATADQSYEQAVAQARSAHAAVSERAAAMLQQAVDQHDTSVGECNRVLQSKTDRATTTRAAAVEKALGEFDDQMRRQHEAPEVAVVTAPSGVLELRSGRQRLAGIVPQGPDVWRVDLPEGAVFVPSATAARRLLWSALQPDEEAAVA